MVILDKILPHAHYMKGKLSVLTVALLLLMILGPALEGGLVSSLILSTVISVILIIGVYVASYDRKHMLLALAYGIPALTFNWLFNFYNQTFIAIPDVIFTTLFFGYVTIVILEYILKSERITNQILYGAISVYLLIGITWASFFNLIERIVPGSFLMNNSAEVAQVFSWTDYMYYSFVTLTTLGYGDMIPVSEYARTFAVLESVAGVMFSTLLVARLVALYAKEL